MKLRDTACALILATTLPFAAAYGQQVLVVGGQPSPMLRMGTEVPVKTRVELSTQHKALQVGQRFEVETTEPISLNGKVIIPVGTPGVGEITSVRNKGMWGKSGHFDVRLLFLRVGDRQIKLTGIADNKGTAGGIGAAAVSAVVFLPAGFFMTGTSARLPAGTLIKGSLDEDVPVAFANTTPVAPLTVAAPDAPVSTMPAVVPAAATSPAIVQTSAVAKPVGTK